MNTNLNSDNDRAYVEAGERSLAPKSVAADQVAEAFGVDRSRVLAALAGEFGLGPNARIDGAMAQQLADVLLGDLPMDRQEAALLALGVFTPRRDAVEGIGSEPPREESDRLSAKADVPSDTLASNHSSYAPSTTDSE